jgi:hypothetical protein
MQVRAPSIRAFPVLRIDFVRMVAKNGIRSLPVQLALNNIGNRIANGFFDIPGDYADVPFLGRRG